MEIKEMNGVPTEKGYYFARRRTKSYWETLVLIGGKAPFLTIIHETSLFKVDDSVMPELTDAIYSERLDLTDLK